MVRYLFTSMLLALLQAPLSVSACSHLWRIDEVYSSPDRTIQFIELKEVGNSPFEWGIGPRWFKTNSYNNIPTPVVLGPNLPPVSTAGKRFLVATDSYAALPGVPPRDYGIPDGAINPDGDTITWWAYQFVIFPSAGQPTMMVPTDGTNSLHLTNPHQFNPPPVFATGVNTPTNFAGQTGTVVLASTIPAASRAWLAVLAFGLVGLGLLAIA
ncbi:MAG: hypothetical protein ACREKH_06660, partial [Candidatus Rokuibacteriota bacterium]